MFVDDDSHLDVLYLHLVQRVEDTGSFWEGAEIHCYVTDALILGQEQVPEVHDPDHVVE